MTPHKLKDVKLTIAGQEMEVNSIMSVDFGTEPSTTVITQIERREDRTTIIDVHHVSETSHEDIYRWFMDCFARYPVTDVVTSLMMQVKDDREQFVIDMMNTSVYQHREHEFDVRCQELVVWLVCPHGWIADNDTFEMAKGRYRQSNG